MSVHQHIFRFLFLISSFQHIFNDLFIYSIHFFSFWLFTRIFNYFIVQLLVFNLINYFVFINQFYLSPIKLRDTDNLMLWPGVCLFSVPCLMHKAIRTWWSYTISNILKYLPCHQIWFYYFYVVQPSSIWSVSPHNHQFISVPYLRSVLTCCVG